MLSDSEKEMILYLSFSQFGAVTEETRRRKENLTFLDNIRLNLGMYRTDVEKEEYRVKTLRRPLP